MKRLTIIVYLLVCSLGLPSLAADPLVWKFKTGDEHHFRMRQDMDMSMTINSTEKPIETSVQQVIDMTWKIDQVDLQGQAIVVQTIDRLQMDMQAPGQQATHFDTDSDESPSGFAAMLVPLYKAMTANSYKLTMSPQGKIKAVDIPEALTKAMEAVPGAAMMGEMFSDEGFKNMIQKSSLILPAPGDLSPGHEWTSTTEMKNPLLGTITNAVTYRYVGARETDGATLEVFAVDMELDFGEGIGGTQLDVTNQESNGEILFNRDAGCLESSKLQQDIEMSLSVATQEMKQKMVTKVAFERVEKPLTE